MMLAFPGERRYDPTSGYISYTVLLDGEEITCAIDNAVVTLLCDEFIEPLQIFDSCHMLILEYTKKRLCGETSGFCGHILFREQRLSDSISVLKIDGSKNNGL